MDGAGWAYKGPAGGRFNATQAAQGRPANGSHGMPENAVIPNLLEQGTEAHKLLQFLTNKLNHANHTIKQLEIELEQLKRT